jgi:hypothetical protein
MAEIADFLKARDAARNDKAPLPVPDAMTNPAAKPEERQAAEEAYTSSLLNRRSLTDAETKWLAGRISECLHGMRSTGERR